MDKILEWGIDFIVYIQQYRTPFIDSFFLYITSLGGDTFYFLIFSYLYWCVDTRETARFLVLFCISFWINSELKNLLNQPRPYYVQPELKIGHSAGGGGLPSFHAQGSLLFWGYLSRWFKKRPFYILAVILVLLIAFSRIYLGRHYPSDILGGWIIAFLLLLIFYKSHEKIEEFLLRKNLYIMISIALIVPVLLSFVKPNAWTVSAMGFLGGFGVGYILMREHVDFKNSGSYLKKAIRFVIGILVLGALQYGLRDLLPHIDSNLYFIIIFIRFSLMGLWISIGAPWIFKKINLESGEAGETGTG